MADPFSIISSAAGLIDIATRAGTGIVALCKDLKEAPNLICALGNEAAELQIILTIIRNTKDHFEQLSSTENILVQTAGPTWQTIQYAAKDLEKELGPTQQALEKLNNLILQLQQYRKVERSVRWLLERSKASAICDELRERRTRLNDIMIAHNR
jgi:hypothetical protein